MNKFVRRDDFVDEYHQCPTYVTSELVDKPEDYFVDDGLWDGGTSGGDIADEHGFDVYYFWRELDDETVEVLLEVYQPIEVIAYCTIKTGLGDMSSYVLIEHLILAEKLGGILSALKKAIGL